MRELLRLRQEIGYTQLRMAEATGMDLRTYQRVEKYGGRLVYLLAARWVHHEVMAAREVA